MARTTEEKRVAKRLALQRWRAANPEKNRELDRKWRTANPEKARAKDQKRYLADIENQRKRARDYNARNREKVREACRKWRANNTERVAKYNAEYMPAWMAKNGDYIKRYCIEHAEDIRARARKRAAIKKGAPGCHSAADIAALFEKQRGRCAYFPACGTEIKRAGKGKYHIDHIEPLKPKSQTRPVGSNAPDNLQLLCPACNHKKKNKDPYKFTQEHAGRLFPDLPVEPKRRRQA